MSKGFCFVWVRGLGPGQVIRRMGAKELERIGWQQMVGAGDGQSGDSGKLYFGVTRLDDTWTVVIEDNGGFGAEDGILRSLSVGTRVVCLYRAANGDGRFLVLEDEGVALEFDPTGDLRASGSRAAELEPTLKAVGMKASAPPQERVAAAFALAERLTGVPVDLAGLQRRTYLFSVVPTGQ